jgi:hypothetical protein
MQPSVSTQPPPPPAPAAKPAAPRRSSGKFALTVLVLVIVAFLLGYIPNMLESRRLAASLHETEVELQLANLHRTVGVASHEAMRNNYASAGSAARAFFDGCRDLAAREEMPDRPRTHGALVAYAASADETMSELAAADPRAKERLASLFLTMQGLLERRQ